MDLGLLKEAVKELTDRVPLVPLEDFVRGLAERLSHLRFLLPFLLIALVVTPSIMASPIDLGLAGSFAVFGLGSTMAVGTTGDPLGNTFEIYGDVAVGADTSSATGTGFGDFQKGFIQGNLWADKSTVNSPGYATWSFAKDAGVTGTIDGAPSPCTNTAGCGGGGFNGTGNTDLSQAVSDAVVRSAFYAGLPGTSLGAYSPGATDSLTAGVYSATDVHFNGTVLTITGTAADSFVLNVSGDFDFAQSVIVLSGGITADNVLFNITGTGPT